MWIPISLAARICGVCSKTLRRWEIRGLLKPARTPGGHRRYSQEALINFLDTGIYHPKLTRYTGIAAVYGRVSASKQKKDLQTQVLALSQQAQNDGFTPKIYTDIGSGLNDKHPRFLRLLIDAIHRRFDRVSSHIGIDWPDLGPIAMKKFSVRFRFRSFAFGKLPIVLWKHS